ncbi:hypothetical protein BC629DRAFT_1440532 [Irpex lacteus]|nr:hypothetical protein BC629DRAFT_1440532 [Irpex lacteus]
MATFTHKSLLFLNHHKRSPQISEHRRRPPNSSASSDLSTPSLNICPTLVPTFESSSPITQDYPAHLVLRAGRKVWSEHVCCRITLTLTLDSLKEHYIRGKTYVTAITKLDNHTVTRPCFLSSPTLGKDAADARQGTDDESVLTHKSLYALLISSFVNSFSNGDREIEVVSESFCYSRKNGHWMLHIRVVQFPGALKANDKFLLGRMVLWYSEDLSKQYRTQIHSGPGSVDLPNAHIRLNAMGCETSCTVENDYHPLAP